jgi:N utilization substance protein B
MKVMQTLYSLETEASDIDQVKAQKLLLSKIELSHKLLLYLLQLVTEVALYAEKDAIRRAGKHLPTDQDLSVNTKIAGNTLIWKIRNDEVFLKAVKDAGLLSLLPEEQIKRIYQLLVQSAEYVEYNEPGERSKQSEKKILDFIFNGLMLQDENILTHLEEHFINWDDDGENMVVIINNYFSKPTSGLFGRILSPEKTEFAKNLLRTVIEKKEVTMEMIRPKLKNWDADRIASLDLIILQMGICEFLYFDTIPTKVTINEYIDLAKEYSTPQSGQFINGLLDNIHKDLLAANKIQKRVFRNSTL